MSRAELCAQLNSLGFPLAGRDGTRTAARRQCRDPPDVHILSDALELGDAGLGCKGREQLLDTLGVMDGIREIDLVGVGQMLHASGDVDGLAKIVEPVVEGDRDRRALMHADLEDQLAIRSVAVGLIS